MNSEDLNKSHYKIWEKNPEISQSKEHTKLSIQFSIEVLESTLIDTNDLYADEFDYFFNDRINNKIQELKQYYDSQI